MSVRTGLYGLSALSYLVLGAVAVLAPRLLHNLTPREQFWAGIGFTVVWLAGWVAHLRDVFRSPRVPVEKKPFWAILIFLLGPLAMPFYFFRYIFGEGQPAPPAPPTYSGWATAAGYLGVLSVFAAPAPFSVVASSLALRDLRRNQEKRGRNRAIFGLVMGLLGTAGLVLSLLWYPPL
jgi:hypothetical protein